MVRAPAFLTTAPRFAALGSLLITLAGFVVIVAGLAKLQQTTNGLGSNLPAETVTQYETTFTQSLIQPYPADHHFQFSFIWFIIFGQLFVLLLCAIVLGVKSFHHGRLAALTFLAIICTLTINVVYNLVFLHKSQTANTVYNPRHINTTLAGALLVVLGNVATILTLGFFEPFHNHTNTYYGTNKAAVAPGVGGVNQPGVGGVGTVAETRV